MWQCRRPLRPKKSATSSTAPPLSPLFTFDLAFFSLVCVPFWPCRGRDIDVSKKKKGGKRATRHTRPDPRQKDGRVKVADWNGSGFFFLCHPFFFPEAPLIAHRPNSRAFRWQRHGDRFPIAKNAKKEIKSSTLLDDRQGGVLQKTERTFVRFDHLYLALTFFFFSFQGSFPVYPRLPIDAARPVSALDAFQLHSFAGAVSRCRPRPPARLPLAVTRARQRPPRVISPGAHDLLRAASCHRRRWNETVGRERERGRKIKTAG